MTKIFVAGATGIQGSAVIRHLTQDPTITIHALVRNPSSPSAKSLDDLNVKLFPGNFDDPTGILAATKDCTAAFLNVTPVFTDPAGESRHAQNLVSACTHIPRIVFSSSGAMHTPPTDPVWTEFVPNNPHDWMTVYLTSKKACEDAMTPDTCILRGGTFTTNILPPHSLMMYPDLREGRITTALREDYVLSFIDPDDLGRVAAEILLSERWEEFRGQALPVGAQNLTFRQFVGMANRELEGSGKKIEIEQLTEKEAEERSGQGDMVVSSQIFQNKYHRAFREDELMKFGIRGEKVASVREFFERRREDLLAAVGG